MTVVRGLEEELTNEFEEVRPPTLRSVVSCNGPRRTSNFTFRAPQENFTIDDFELGPVLGVGSFSKVVRVKKKDTGNVYALKIMDKDFITKQHKVSHVKQERIVLDQLNHPGIVQLLFTFQDSNSLYMAFEACEGGELFDQITRKGRIFEDEARFYIAEIIDVLEYLHGIGLIHRDIKPENLLLTANGHVKVADFGSVKVTEGTRILLPPLAASETTGSFEGTAAYVPPEVLNTSTTTIANDHWALGCTLYQMLSGTSPFQDSSEWLMFKKIKSRDIKFPVYFSDEAIDLIDNLLDSTGESKKSNSDVALFKTSASGFGSNTTPSLEFHSVLLASVDSFDSRWQEFLEPGESIVLASKLKKLRLLTSKKVQLILTNKPRLFYVNPSKSMENMKIIWSDNPNGISVQVLNPSHFKVCTPMKLSSFEDKKQLAWHWKRAIEGLANH
ncbi:hypothetical protein KFK09_013986 [Dendrobium nobile]|uniref:non-specific serine/threonine protein kinase n=1 Tax=Dendrobium nobile TaxID=94219 RepID=A0A8T3BAK8_DENNO|nr:hypothetical protein KFK09_013986 [Dendrobium nobile]